MKESNLQEPLLNDSKLNHEKQNKNPLETANFLERMFFTWVFPILKVKYRIYPFIQCFLMIIS